MLIRYFVCQVSMAVLTICALTSSVRAQEDANMKDVFESKYKVWKDFMQSPDSRYLSDTTGITAPQFDEIVKLGIPALPFIFEKMESDPILCVAAQKITKKKFHTIRTGEDPNVRRWSVEEFPDINNVERIDWPLLWLIWWNDNGGSRTSEQFEKLYNEWKTLKKTGNQIEAEKKYERMMDLGIFALPNMMGKIEQGDTELIKVVSELTDNRVKNDANQSDCLIWWQENKQKWPEPVAK
jgi:hypothetical protein